MLQQGKIPLVTEDLIRQLKAHFSQQAVEPETYRDRLMYEAGQGSIIKFLEQHMSKRQLLGDIENINRVPIA